MVYNRKKPIFACDSFSPEYLVFQKLKILNYGKKMVLPDNYSIVFSCMHLYTVKFSG